jgi:hypothetical protein
MQKRWINPILAALLVAGIVSCAATPQPFTYHNDRDEKPGPGLFSGDKGGYVIYGQDAGPQQPADAKTAPLDAE